MELSVTKLGILYCKDIEIYNSYSEGKIQYQRSLIHNYVCNADKYLLSSTAWFYVVYSPWFLIEEHQNNFPGFFYSLLYRLSSYYTESILNDKDEICLQEIS